MVSAFCLAPALVTFAQQASQPAAYPSIHAGEDRFIAVFEVAKPATQREVDICDDDRQRPSVGSPRLDPDCFPQLLHAFVTRPATAAFKAVTEEFKGLDLGIDDPRFLRMQR